MTGSRLEQATEAVQALLGEGAILVFVPSATTHSPGTEQDTAAGFNPDLTIPQFIERFAPGMSESRVADWCRDEEFPDVVDEDGTVVPGAYKDRGQWFITLNGIRERQRLARERGLLARQRDRAVASGPTWAVCPPVRVESKVRETRPGRSESSTSADRVGRRVPGQRAKKDAWKNVKKAS